MKILILVDCYVPDTRSAAKQMRDLAVEFRRRGHQVAVATPASDAIQPGEAVDDDGVTVFRVRTGPLKDVGLVRRAWNEMRLSPVFWRQGGAFFRANRFDVVIQYAPTIFFAKLVRRLARLWQCPSYLILRDIFPQWAVDAGVMRKGLPYHYFRFKEWQQYRSFDVIGVQSPANLVYFRDRGWEKISRLEVLYNWSATDAPPPAKVDYRKSWRLEGSVVFFYGGNIGVAQDMDNLVRLAKALEFDPRLRVVIIGSGSETTRLKALEASGVAANLIVRDGVSQSEFAAMVGQFDVGLITLDRRLTTQNFPGKFFSYLAAGIPVLASINPGNDLAGLISETGVGLVTVNGDDAAFVANARRLADDAVLRRSMGVAGRELLLSRFSVETAAAQILAAVGLGASSGSK